MKKITIFLISSIATLIAIIIYAVQYELILIRFPSQLPTIILPISHTKKKINLYFWQNGHWSKESQDLLWSTDNAANLETVIIHWLTTLQAEQIVPKKVTLQTVILAPDKHNAFISFDRSLYQKSWSIERKWMVIEGLLKTVRDASIPVTALYFLVNHQPMNDPHLDFSSPLPIRGFLQT